MTAPADPARDDAQDRTTDPETTMTDDKTTPPESPAPAPRPSVAAPPVPVAVQVLDRAVDLAAIAAVCWICLSGRLSGELAVVAIGAIAGAQTGLRSVLSARGGPSVGVAGLVLLAGLTALSAPATAAAAGGVAAAAGTLGQRGHVRGGLLALLAVLALAVLGATAQGCRTAREVVMRAAPGVPEASGCAANTQRCNGQVPEVCSASGRWWPSLPVRPDGTQRECVSCVVEDGVAGCAR